MPLIAILCLLLFHSYFDLRISRNPKDNHFYFVHGLYCEKVTEPLAQFRRFMNEHPSEFIVFDCQHFYNFANGDYQRLEKIIRTIFHEKFYTRDDGKLTEMTLNKTSKLNRQLLVIYRYGNVPVEFWPSDEWPTPWPNQFKVKQLENSLETNIKQRSPNTGYVTQCVLTPPVRFIVPRWVEYTIFKRLSFLFLLLIPFLLDPPSPPLLTPLYLSSPFRTLPPCLTRPSSLHQK